MDSSSDGSESLALTKTSSAIHPLCGNSETHAVEEHTLPSGDTILVRTSRSSDSRSTARACITLLSALGAMGAITAMRLRTLSMPRVSLRSKRYWEAASCKSGQPLRMNQRHDVHWRTCKGARQTRRKADETVLENVLRIARLDQRQQHHRLCRCRHLHRCRPTLGVFLLQLPLLLDGSPTVRAAAHVR